MVGKVDFQELSTYLAVVARVVVAAAGGGVPYRGVAVSPPTTLSASAPASLVDILF